jgi:hypothetical protein
MAGLQTLLTLILDFVDLSSREKLNKDGFHLQLCQKKKDLSLKFFSFNFEFLDILEGILGLLLVIELL